MQNDFLTGSLANWDAERVKSAVLKKIKNEKWDYIYFTRDTHQRDYLNTSEGKHLPVKHCIEGTPGWCVDEDLMVAAEEKPYAYIEVINKKTFGSKDLIDNIESRINWSRAEFEITLVGVCTGICVVSNALLLKANDTIREQAEIICDAECCSCLNQHTHESALDTMECCQVTIINRNKKEE